MNLIGHLCMIEDQAHRFFDGTAKLKIELCRHDGEELRVTIVTGKPYLEMKESEERFLNEWWLAHWALTDGIHVDFEHVYPPEGTPPE